MLPAAAAAAGGSPLTNSAALDGVRDRLGRLRGADCVVTVFGGRRGSGVARSVLLINTCTASAGCFFSGTELTFASKAIKSLRAQVL